MITWGTILVALAVFGTATLPARAQTEPEVSFSISVRTDAGDAESLTVGVDGDATSEIDPDLGEEEQPPLPPSSIFDARLIDDDIPVTGFGEGLVRDIRPGSSPLSDTTVHEVHLQPGADATSIAFSWDLPAGITGHLRDVVTDGDEVDVSMSDSGSYSLTNLNVTKLTLRVAYDLRLSATDDSYTTDEDRQLVVDDPAAGVLRNDAGRGSLKASLATRPAHGTLTFHADGTFSYSPASNFYGVDGFTYEASNDVAGPVSGAVTLTVRSVNDPPVSTSSIPDQTLTVGAAPLQITNLTSAFSDPEGDALSFSATSSDPGVLDVAGIDDGVSLDPSSAGTASVTVTASDGQAEANAPAFEVSVQASDPSDELPDEQASALVTATSGAQSLPFGGTGVSLRVESASTGGMITVAFYSGENAKRGAATATTTAYPNDFDNVSPYRWEVDAGSVHFETADLRLDLDNENVTGVGAPESAHVIVDSTGDGAYGPVTTTYDDGGTAPDSTDDALLANGLSSLGTFKLASNDENNPLPVELTTFTATVDGRRVLLEWTTASETSNAGFRVEHLDPGGQTFTAVGFVSGAGSTTHPQSYRYALEDLRPGRHRFRLRQLDVDGSSYTTDPIAVTVTPNESLALRLNSANPVQQEVSLAFRVKRAGDARVALYNLLGQRIRVLHEGHMEAEEQRTATVRMDGLPSGTYLIHLTAPTGTRTRRITVVH